MCFTQIIGERHLSCNPAYPYKHERVNAVRVTKFKVFLSFIHPTASPCCVPVVPCHVMRYRDLNPHILSTFSRLSLSDNIYIFPNFYLGVFSSLYILQKLQVRLFAFTWCYFDLSGISFNTMYYFHRRIDRLAHCNFVVIIPDDE